MTAHAPASVTTGPRRAESRVLVGRWHLSTRHLVRETVLRTPVDRLLMVVEVRP